MWKAAYYCTLPSRVNLHAHLIIDAFSTHPTTDIDNPSCLIVCQSPDRSHWSASAATASYQRRSLLIIGPHPARDRSLMTITPPPLPSPSPGPLRSDLGRRGRPAAVTELCAPRASAVTRRQLLTSHRRQIYPAE